MRLLEAALGTALSQGRGTTVEQLGLYVTQLLGKQLGEMTARRPGEPEALGNGRSLLPRRREADGLVFHYDEWDHVIGDYRPDWCRLIETAVAEDAGIFYEQTLARHAALVPELRRHFQRLRPEMYRVLRGLEDGDDFDLGAAVDARAQIRARRTPSPKLYTSRVRQERDVATLFLVDLSASTDEEAAGAPDGHRIIDVTREALVLMAAALEEIGDAYAIYGFSGQGRERVEFFGVKDFDERLSPAVKGRIGGLEPHGSTRMGTAIRHALTKMRGVTAPSRHLLLLSDGFPQDLDYGDDRQSHVYGIRDTATALREAQAAGVRPYCITVDLAGHDYLRDMCDPNTYLVIENVADLPRELPKIYQRVVQTG
jgi:nitric oxide reductase activation protein